MAVGAGGGGGGAGAGAIRAGRAFIEFFAKDDGLKRSLAGIQKRLHSFGGSLTRVGGGLLGAGGLALAPLAGLFKGGLDQANQLKDLQDAYGLTAEGISKLGFAAAASGLELEDLDTMLFRLGKENKTGKPLDEYFIDVVDTLNAIEDPSERAAKAFDLLGKNGKKILPVLGDLGERLGQAPLISQETLNNAETFQQEISRLGYVVTAALAPVVTALVPVAKQFAEFAQQNAYLLKYAAGAAAGVVALGAAFTAAGFAISGIATTLGAVVTAVTFIATPLGAAVVAVGALAAGFVYLTGIGQTLGETFQGIADALALGDLELAWAIAVKGLELEWARLLETLQSGWNDFKAFFVDGWHDAVMLVKLVVVDMLDFLKQQFGNWVAKAALALKMLNQATGGVLFGFANLDPLLDLGVEVGTRDTDVVRDRITREAREAQAARDEARAAALEDAATDRQDAEAERLKLLTRAAFRRAFGKGGGGEGGPGLPDLLGAVGKSVGAFGSTVGGRQFARTEGILNKQLDVLEDIEDGIEELNRKGPVVWGA